VPLVTFNRTKIETDWTDNFKGFKTDSRI